MLSIPCATLVVPFFSPLALTSMRPVVLSMRSAPSILGKASVFTAGIACQTLLVWIEKLEKFVSRASSRRRPSTAEPCSMNCGGAPVPLPRDMVPCSIPSRIVRLPNESISPSITADVVRG